MGNETMRACAGLKIPLLGDLIILMRSRFIVLLPVVLMLAYTPWAYSDPAFVRATTLTGRVVNKGSGAGIPDVTVSLFGPGNVSMDVTSTNKEGHYTIDLDVLEDKELANLEFFFLEVDVQGKFKKRTAIKKRLILKGSVLRFVDIRLP